MRAWLSVLRPPHIQCAFIEVDLRPFQFADLGSSQRVPIANRHHCLIAQAVPIALCCLDQPVYLFRSKVLTAAIFGVWQSLWAHCSFFGGWGNRPHMGFCRHSSLPTSATDRTRSILRAVRLFLLRRA